MDRAQGAVVLMRNPDPVERPKKQRSGWLFRLEAFLVGGLVIVGMLATFGGLL